MLQLLNKTPVLAFTELLLLLHTLNGLFYRTTWVSRYQEGKTSLDLNEARDYGVLGWQWHQPDRPDDMQTICTLLQTDNHTNTSSLNFYTLDTLPEAQQIVSKHWLLQNMLHYINITLNCIHSKHVHDD